MLGTTSVKVTEGIGLFDSIQFTSSPGATNIPFSFTSDAIDMSIMRKQYGQNYSLKNITVNFRFCKPGEIQDGLVCRSWSPGSYSFTWNSTQCKNCMSNADWLGEEQVSVNEGYWRYTKNSTMIVEWPNINACLGGYNATASPPVFWEKGYTGLLCSEWAIYEDTK